VVTVRNNCILNVTLCSLVGGDRRLEEHTASILTKQNTRWTYSTPCLKHLWVYVTTWVANLTEEKSLCVFNEILGMARLVPIVSWEYNFVIFWSCDKLRHYLMMTHPRRCFRHTITNYFRFIKYFNCIRMRIQNVKGQQKQEDILCVHSGAYMKLFLHKYVAIWGSHSRDYPIFWDVTPCSPLEVHRPASISQTRSKWLIIDNFTLNMRYFPPNHQ
jgi:hypothetical protein